MSAMTGWTVSAPSRRIERSCASSVAPRSVGIVMVAALAALAVPPVAAAQAPPRARSADLILHGAVVFTAEDAAPGATAVAIRGSTIAAVGSDDSVLEMRGPDTAVLDLAGAFVVPGFVDTHVHFASAARFLEFNVMTARTQQQFADCLRDAVARVPEGEWILGGFWGAYDAWELGSEGIDLPHDQRFTPDLRALGELADRHPMFLRRFDDSEFLANALALSSVGIDPEDPRANGVEFARDGDGRPTGVLRGPGAERLFAGRSIRPFSRARRIAQTRGALVEIARRGVTTISDMSDDEQLSIWRELRATGELTVRVDFRHPLERWRELADLGVRTGRDVDSDPWIRLGGLKGHIDGIMGTSTARFLEPYSNSQENRGRWRALIVDERGEYADQKFFGFLRDADAAGLQLTVHAIGDEANRVLLDLLERLTEVNGRRDRRFRLVHAQVIAAPDFPRLGELGAVAEVQPFHLSDDMRWMEERIGRERCRGAYAFRAIQASGATLCFGSDWPGTSASAYPIDPLLGIHAAVTRQTVRGTPESGWFPEQRLGVEDALRAYTIGGAYASFEEDRKGSITPGKLADLVVLSRNLLECDPRDILATEVLFTLVGGRVVHRHP